jgi:5-methylcytosine-specific restriction protein A
MLPKLNLTDRSREYDLYSPFIRGRAAFQYLTEPKLGHREIDRKILGKDPSYTRGYQAMGILHYQGLYKNHCGQLTGYSLDEVIEEVAMLENSERLTADLRAFKSSDPIDKLAIEEKLAEDVLVALSDGPDRRRVRLASKPDMSPRKIAVTSTAFIRDPDVIAEALFRASGQCEDCKKKAPFFRKSDGRPYLEVHHKIPLAKGGKDTIDNVLALCPNCHRKAHFG